MMEQSPIRVLQIVDTLGGGGAERIVIDILKHIDSRRFRPSVCVTRNLGPFADEIRQLNIPIYCMQRNSRYDLKGFGKLVKLMRETRPHIVHTHKVGSNTLGRIAALLAGVPVIIAHEHTMPERSRTQRWLDTMLARWATCVITCDAALKKALVAGKQIDPRKFVVIYNGVDLERFNLETTDAMLSR